MERESPTLSRFRSVVASVGRQHEKPLRLAFYNTAALLFLVISSIVAVSAYYVLEAFLRPLIWAALCGTFLFPFKKTMTRIVHLWLTNLEEAGTPLLIGSALLPFRLISKAIEQLERIVKSNWKLLLSVIALVPLCYGLVIFHPFDKIIYAIGSMIHVSMTVLALFNKPIAVWSLFVCYIMFLLLWNNVEQESEILVFMNKSFSVVIWFLVVFYVISLTGSWKLPIVIFLFCLMFAGYMEQKNTETMQKVAEEDPNKSKKVKNPLKSVVDTTLTVIGIKKVKPKIEPVLDHSSLSDCSVDAAMEPEEPEEPEELPISVEEVFSPSTTDTSAPLSIRTPSIDRKTSAPPSKLARKKNRNRSTPYFIALFWVFGLSVFWRHIWFVSILIILLPLKYVISTLMKSELVQSKLRSVFLPFKNFYLKREEIIFPWVCRKSLSLLHGGDKKLIGFINTGLDKLMSIIMVLCLILLASLATAFFAVQVQQESSYLVTVATDVVNHTVTSNKEYLQWLNINDSDIRTTVDDTIRRGYLVARVKMAKYVSSVMAGKNTTHMELQLTQLMDQLYHTWAGQNTVTAKDKIQGSRSSLPGSDAITSQPSHGNATDAWGRLQKLVTSSDYMKVLEIIKENVHTMYSVLDSVWLIVKGNVNLMLSLITTIFSMLFQSGTYILNSLISCIIFMTTLFYLLNSSAEEYKVMEWLSGLSIGTRFGESISNAVQDVFGASLKMATFYFFFTWLTHDMFGANLVFIPAAFAAILGVVLFIGTYWAAIPAALELWLIQNNGVLSLSLIVFHFLPTYVVDTAIYSEIGEGGNPYLTGLAVSGGVYCFGLEGAFIGPFVLCCLIAAFEIYNGIMNSNDYRDRAMSSPTKAS